jgi:hypothetical protein
LLLLAPSCAPAGKAAPVQPAEVEIAQPLTVPERPGPVPVTPAVAAAPRAAEGEVEARLRRLERAGDGAWDDDALAILIEAFDRDGSRLLDSPLEIDAIPCSVLSVLDADLKANNHAGLAVTYGFAPGFIWVGTALGFQEALRAEAYAAMARCGVGND